MTRGFRAFHAAVAALLLAGVQPAYPWGGTGHRVVAIIAEERLSPEVLQRVRHLLFDGKYTMADISSCADQIRSGPPRPNSRFPHNPACDEVAGKVTENTGPWHYIDIPVPTKEKDLEKFCPNGDCVVDQIERFTKILRESNDDAARRKALLFLVHFVGDIHQPLHGAERACDQGGNRELVNFTLGDQKLANQHLHSVWDGQVVEKLMKDSGFATEGDLVADLMDRVADDDASAWGRAAPAQMAWESYKIAKRFVYKGIPFQNYCDKSVTPGPAVDLKPSYEATGARIARERLMKAGVRLAALLEANLTH